MQPFSVEVMAYEWATGEKVSIDQLMNAIQAYKAEGKRIVTTNGCFDLLHVGHLHNLSEARSLGDVLIVGLNSDSSVRQLKGPGRPIVNETDRAAMLIALKVVDHVVVFDDLLPNDFLSLVRPDIHCKAGDYDEDGLPEAEGVRAHGGEVRILPLVPGYSTSLLMQQIVAAANAYVDVVPDNDDIQTLDRDTLIAGQFYVGSNLLRQMAYRLNKPVSQAADMVIYALQSGHKVMVCGNGGSAADAQHFAAELVGRFRRDRQPLPAIALTTDTSILTSLGNDYGFENIFSRQVTALGQAGDVLVAISTSGQSPNILAAVGAAHSRKMKVVAFTGIKTSPLVAAADFSVCVPSQDTAQIQQGHIAAFHIICDLAERALGGG